MDGKIKKEEIVQSLDFLFEIADKINEEEAAELAILSLKIGRRINKENSK